MDEPDLDPALLERAYRSLSLICRISRTVPRVAGAIERWLSDTPSATGRPLRILDVGSGGGDLIVGIGRWARRRGHAFQLMAADLNPRALLRTEAVAQRARLQVTGHHFDAGVDAIPGAPDIVISSLFLHHLSDDALAAFLRAIARSEASLAIMNDLARHRIGLIAATWTARLVTRNPVVHADAPQSVRAALTAEELRAHCRSAGLDGARVREVFPFRMQMEWRRP